MNSNSHNQAVALLTAYFSKPAKGEPKPLSAKEWGRFALWMNEKSLRPVDLLAGSLDKTLTGWTDRKITIDRLEWLLGRGSALAIAMEKWSRAGIWLMTRADADYPKRLKKRLKTDAPPLLFGVGNRRLLGQVGLAVIGSRNTSAENLDYAAQLGAATAEQGFFIISGGARGVDEKSMLGALEVEGTAVGILANELLRAGTSSKYRKYLMNDSLVLISPFYPDAGFNVGNAMQRNKYIYALADAAVVVHSGTKGGTWTGANENLKNAWVPLWVKPTDDAEAGNKLLVEAGGQWLPAGPSPVDIKSLFSSQVIRDQQAALLPMAAGGEPGSLASGAEEEKSELRETDAGKGDGEQEKELPGFYSIFLGRVEQECKDEPKTVEQLIELLGLHKSQLNIWLKQAVEEGFLEKKLRPVRYRWAGKQRHQVDLFGN